MTTVAETTQAITTEYNGWGNRETWVVNMWLTNDQCYYDELCDITRNFDMTDEQVEELEWYVHWLIDINELASMTSDLLTTSLGRVNWYEIIETNKE